MEWASVAFATDLYVSPGGAGDCTSRTSRCSVADAQGKIRAFASSAFPVSVWMDGGAYGTMEFDERDSGRGGTVTWASDPESEAGKATVFGGSVLDGWEAVSGKSGWWRAPVTFPTRQLYVDGGRVGVSRLNSTITDATATQTATGYLTSSTTPLAWTLPHLVEFVYTGMGSSWTEPRCRVQAVTQRTDGKSGSNITMVEPCYSMGRSRVGGSQAIKFPFYLENVYEELGVGEWLYNGSASGGYVVYASGDSGEMPQDVVVPTTELLLRVQGVQGMVENLVFSNLTFSTATWNAPTFGNGYIDLQSGFVFTPATNPASDLPLQATWGNVQLANVSGVVVEGCEFVHLGGTALTCNTTCQHVTVTRSTFHDVSAGGIVFGEVNDNAQTNPSLQNAFLEATDNLLFDLPKEYHSGAGILLGYVRNGTVAHNTILDPSNTGVSVGWGWGASSYMENNNIIANLVSGSNWLLKDGGALYTLSAQPNSQMAYNHVNNQRQLFGSLYCDEGSAYWHVHHNVVERSPEWLHLWTGSIHDITVDNNWSTQTYSINHGTNCTVENNTFILGLDPFPTEAQLIKLAAGSTIQYIDAI